MPHAEDRRTPGIARGTAFQIILDGESLTAYEGESVLGVLWACGRRVLRRSPVKAEPRGFLCGMGVCFECLVTVDGRPNVRACLQPAKPGMRIETGTRDAQG